MTRPWARVVRRLHHQRRAPASSSQQNSSRRTATLALSWASKLAILSWTAHAHWALAEWLGMPWQLCWCLPVAVDAYVVAALLSHHAVDTFWALTLDIMAVSGSLALSAVPIRQTSQGQHAQVGGLLGGLLILVLWRVHRLTHTVTTDTDTANLQVNPGLAVRHDTTPGTDRPTTTVGPTPTVGGLSDRQSDTDRHQETDSGGPIDRQLSVSQTANDTDMAVRQTATVTDMADRHRHSLTAMSHRQTATPTVGGPTDRQRHRQKVADIVTANPDMSARDLAALAGVSPRTIERHRQSVAAGDTMAVSS